MRTTLNLDEQLMRLAKQRAAKRGITLTQLMDEALRSSLSETPPPGGVTFKLELLTKRGTALAGVDIDDRDALTALMDEDR